MKIPRRSSCKIRQEGNQRLQKKREGESLSKIIGFLGSDPADLCMYTAYVLQNMGTSVCVIDNSTDGALFACIPAPDEQLETVTFRNVDFMRFRPLTQWHELDYAFILVQLGESPQELCLASCSERVLVLGCDKRELDFYSRFMRRSSMTMSVVLRGFCPNGPALWKIKERLTFENCFVERWILLPFDQEDERYRIIMQYEQIYKFVHISAGMERALIRLLGLLEFSNPVRMLGAVKAAKKGKTAGDAHNAGPLKTVCVKEKKTACAVKKAADAFRSTGTSGLARS